MFDQVAYGFVGLWTCWRQSSGICWLFSFCSREGKTGKGFAMVTVPKETPSLPLLLRDYLALYYGQKSLGKSFFARELIACQISLSLLSFCEAENIFAPLVLNSAREAARGAEVQLLLRTRCLQLQMFELCELWQHNGTALCGVTVLERG